MAKGQQLAASNHNKTNGNTLLHSLFIWFGLVFFSLNFLSSWFWCESNILNSLLSRLIMNLMMMTNRFNWCAILFTMINQRILANSMSKVHLHLNLIEKKRQKKNQFPKRMENIFNILTWLCDITLHPRKKKIPMWSNELVLRVEKVACRKFINHIQNAKFNLVNHIFVVVWMFSEMHCILASDHFCEQPDACVVFVLITKDYVSHLRIFFFIEKRNTGSLLLTHEFHDILLYIFMHFAQV